MLHQFENCVKIKTNYFCVINKKLICSIFNYSIHSINKSINHKLMEEHKLIENNEYYVCYCSKIIKNNSFTIKQHNKSKRHLNYNPNMVLDTRTYYEKNKEKILLKNKTNENILKRKLYNKQYYKMNRSDLIEKNKITNSYSTNNCFVLCNKCKCMYKKYHLTKHYKCCESIMHKLKNKTSYRCLCGTILNKNQLKYHLNNSNHKVRIKYLFRSIKIID